MTPGRTRPLVAVVCLVACLVAAACGTTVPDAQRRLQAGAAGSSGLAGGPQFDGAGTATDASGAPIADGSGSTGSGIDPATGAPVAHGTSGSGTAGTGRGGTATTAGRATATTVAAAIRSKTGPIKVGFFKAVADGNAGAGVNTGATIDQGTAQDAVIDAFNAAGGLAGRKITPVFYEIHQTSTDYAATLAAACQKFTKDDPVELMLGAAGDEAYETCLAKANIPHLVSGPAGFPASLRKQLPASATPAGIDLERRLRVLLEALSDAGWLTKTSRLGILVDGCADIQAAYKSTFLPTAKRLGLNIVNTVETTCAAGYGDLGTLSTQLQTAVVAFRRDNVDRVVFVTDVSPTYAILFGTAAEAQGYRPGYAADSLVQAGILPGNVPDGQLQGYRVAGWLPALDVAPSKLPPTPPALKRCLDLVGPRGIKPSSTADYTYVTAACDTLFLAERVLQTTTGNATVAAVGPALDKVGNVDASAAIEGRGTLGPGRHDGASLTRVVAYDTGCSCMTYLPGTRPTG